MSNRRTYSAEAIGKARAERKGSYRGNPDLRSLAKIYSARGHDPVDAVRRAVEDLFPTRPGDQLEFPGLGVWKMGKERLSHRISDNLRSLRAEPGVWSGDRPHSLEGEESLEAAPRAGTVHPGPLNVGDGGADIDSPEGNRPSRNRAGTGNRPAERERRKG